MKPSHKARQALERGATGCAIPGPGPANPAGWPEFKSSAASKQAVGPLVGIE